MHTALGELELGLPPNGGEEPHKLRPQTGRSATNAAVKEMVQTLVGSLELIIRSVAAGPWHTKQKNRPELIRAAHRYCCLSRNDMSAKKVMA